VKVVKSRHTPLKGKLTRSFGLDDEAKDLVVELNAEQGIVIRKEPADRKLKRGEVLPSVVINPEEAYKNDGNPAMEIAEILTILTRSMPIASFIEGPPNHVDYRAKVWLLAELKQIINEQNNK